MSDKNYNRNELEERIREFEKRGRTRAAVEFALEHGRLDDAAAIYIRNGNYFEAADLYREHGELKKAEICEEMEKKMEPHPMIMS